MVGQADADLIVRLHELREGFGLTWLAEDVRLYVIPPQPLPR